MFLSLTSFRNPNLNASCCGFLQKLSMCLLSQSDPPSVSYQHGMQKTHTHYMHHHCCYRHLPHNDVSHQLCNAVLNRTDAVKDVLGLWRSGQLFKSLKPITKISMKTSQNYMRGHLLGLLDIEMQTDFCVPSACIECIM